MKIDNYTVNCLDLFISALITLISIEICLIVYFQIMKCSTGIIKNIFFNENKFKKASIKGPQVIFFFFTVHVLKFSKFFFVISIQETVEMIKIKGTGSADLIEVILFRRRKLF